MWTKYRIGCTGLEGVKFDSRRKKYYSTLHLGTFDSKEQAYNVFTHVKNTIFNSDGSFKNLRTK